MKIRKKPSNSEFMVIVESCPQATGARLCTKATEAEPRTKDTSEADRAPLQLLLKAPVTTDKLPDSQSGKDTHSSNHPIAPQPITYGQRSRRNFFCPWGYKNWILTHKNWLSLVCQEVGPLRLQCPRYVCSLFLINSLPSEMLCVWKFFSNLCSDCLNSNYLGKA